MLWVFSLPQSPILFSLLHQVKPALWQNLLSMHMFHHTLVIGVFCVETLLWNTIFWGTYTLPYLCQNHYFSILLHSWSQIQFLYLRVKLEISPKPIWNVLFSITLWKFDFRPKDLLFCVCFNCTLVKLLMRILWFWKSALDPIRLD